MFVTLNSRYIQGWALHRVSFCSGNACTVLARCTRLALSMDLKDPERSACEVRAIPSPCQAHREVSRTRRSLRGESCGSRSLARFREKPLLDSVDRAQCTQLSLLGHPDPTNMTTVRLLVVSESTSTASTVGCHCQLAQIRSDSRKSEHDRRSGIVSS